MKKFLEGRFVIDNGCGKAIYKVGGGLEGSKPMIQWHGGMV